MAPESPRRGLRKLKGKATSMPKVLIIQPFHEEGMKLFAARPDVTCEVVDGALEALAEQIVDADGVTIRTSPLPGAVIERAERLKVVSRHGVGYDNIDLAALSRRAIPLAIAADANATAVAEHTLYFMLALAKQGLRYDRATRAGQWAVRNSLHAVDLLGRRVLVMGFGRIGREVAKRCAAFGMAVMVYDPYVQANVIEAAGDYGSVPDFPAALPETDVWTVHMPLGADSRGLIGAAELAALPAHAFVINAARGGIVDEAALYDALTSGTIAGAALDVFDQEPPQGGDHPLFALDNVILTPHSAGLSKEAAIRMAISTAKNVLAGIDGKLDPSMVVNREVL
jgi:D-3-phosphoglycerate dehydrogenase / 2-oxoglutarate reductase